MTNDPQELRRLFERIESTVSREGAHSFTALPMAFALHDAAAKAKKFEDAEDDAYFHEMVRVVFSSGMPAQLATERISAFDLRFSSYKTVAEYDNRFVTELLADPAMRMHDRKIRRLIAMAKSFRYVVAEHGSFSQYLKAKGGTDAASAFVVRADLMKRFTYLGRFTSLLFLIEIGYPILKPDRVVMRVFERLGLVGGYSKPSRELENRRLNEAEIIAALKIGSQIAGATQKPIRYINMILLAFAQGGGQDLLSQAICTAQRPKCFACEVKDRCRFTPKTEIAEARPETFITITAAA